MIITNNIIYSQIIYFLKINHLFIFYLESISQFLKEIVNMTFYT